MLALKSKCYFNLAVTESDVVNTVVDNIDASAVDLGLSKESNVAKDSAIYSDLDYPETPRLTVAQDIGQFATPEISSDLRYKLLKDPWKPDVIITFHPYLKESGNFFLIFAGLKSFHGSPIQI